MITYPGLPGIVLVYACCPDVIINGTLTHQMHKVLAIVYQSIPNFCTQYALGAH